MSLDGPLLEDKLKDPKFQQLKIGPKGYPENHVHILNRDEEKKIPQSEKEELMKMPVEKGCIWFGGKTSTGYEYWFTDLQKMSETAPHFHNMLQVIENTGVTHIGLGGFKFQISKTNKNNINRSKFEPKSPSFPGGQSSRGGGGGYGQQSKPIHGIFIGEYSEVNDFIDKPENKGKWNLYGDWKIDPTSGICKVGISKHTDG